VAKSKIPSKKPKAVKNKKLRLRRKKNQPEQIVIDRQHNLIFSSEDELYAYFKTQIDQLEKEYESVPTEDDFKDEEIDTLEIHLDKTLDEPAEIWHDDKTFKEFPIFHFIRPLEDLNAYHVVVTYVSSDDEPTFIFFHFLTRDLKLVDKFRRGDLVYDRAFEEVGFGAIEGDSLAEGDPLSIGLFIAMLKVRNEADVPYAQFQPLGTEFREDTIENADEIWRSADMHGNNVVNFIKEYPDHEISNLYYVAITLEDASSQMHTLLFSFPTNDESLVDRYRQGDNLQAEDVVQESSH
jgi:hypothetical protein